MSSVCKDFSRFFWVKTVSISSQKALRHIQISTIHERSETTLENESTLQNGLNDKLLRVFYSLLLILVANKLHGQRIKLSWSYKARKSRHGEAALELRLSYEPTPKSIKIAEKLVKSDPKDVNEELHLV